VKKLKPRGEQPKRKKLKASREPVDWLTPKLYKGASSFEETLDKEE
jgi:hypothetical protein